VKRRPSVGVAIAATAILVTAASGAGAEEPATPGLPFVDLAAETSRQVVVDREPGLVRSPGGKRLAALLRDNRRVRNSHIMFSDDEGKTWTAPRELPLSLTGDRHVLRYAPDGRLFATFRDTAAGSPIKGDWVGWVGRFEDIAAGRPGQYRVRLMKNHDRDDCAYPGLELLPDGTFVATTYGHWTPGEPPYVVSVRFTLAELDARRGSPPGREP
jgi:hypothetical protein